MIVIHKSVSSYAWSWTAMRQCQGSRRYAPWHTISTHTSEIKICDSSSHRGIRQGRQQADAFPDRQSFPAMQSTPLQTFSLSLGAEHRPDSDLRTASSNKDSVQKPIFHTSTPLFLSIMRQVDFVTNYMSSWTGIKYDMLHKLLSWK